MNSPADESREMSVPRLSPRFETALAFTARLHAPQVRKRLGSPNTLEDPERLTKDGPGGGAGAASGGIPGVPGIPYIAHLLAVGALALEHGATEDEATAALLHDAVEDRGGEPVAAVIAACFGDEVARIVRACSDAAPSVPGGAKPDWWARKQEYIEHVRRADRSVRLVSACDKLHNARAILADYRTHGEAFWALFKGGRAGTLWYYRALADEFLRGDCPPALAAELDATVRQLERLAAGSMAVAGAVAGAVVRDGGAP